jgi:hypothetical protein
MPLYSKLPNDLTEVDVIIAGGTFPPTLISHHFTNNSSVHQVVLPDVSSLVVLQKQIQSCRFWSLNKALTTTMTHKLFIQLCIHEIYSRIASSRFFGTPTKQNNLQVALPLSLLVVLLEVEVPLTGWCILGANVPTLILGRQKDGVRTT